MQGVYGSKKMVQAQDCQNQSSIIAYFRTNSRSPDLDATYSEILKALQHTTTELLYAAQLPSKTNSQNKI